MIILAVQNTSLKLSLSGILIVAPADGNSRVVRSYFLKLLKSYIFFLSVWKIIRIFAISKSKKNFYI